MGAGGEAGSMSAATQSAWMISLANCRAPQKSADTACDKTTATGYCQDCGKPTAHRKFCDRVCARAYHNKRRPTTRAGRIAHSKTTRTYTSKTAAKRREGADHG